MIKARCGCGAVYQLPDDKAGKSFKCRKCGATVAIPLDATPVSPAPAPSTAQPAKDDFLSMLGGLEAGTSHAEIRELDVNKRRRQASQEASHHRRPTNNDDSAESNAGLDLLWRLVVHPAGLCLILVGVINLDTLEAVRVLRGFTPEETVEATSRVRDLNLLLAWSAIITGVLVVLVSVLQGGELRDMKGRDRSTALVLMVIEGLGLLYVLTVPAPRGPTPLEFNLYLSIFVGTSLLCVVMFFPAVRAIWRDSGFKGVLLSILIPFYAPYWAISRRDLQRHVVFGFIALGAIAGIFRGKLLINWADYPTIAAAQQAIAEQKEAAAADARQITVAPPPPTPDPIKPAPPPEPVKPTVVVPPPAEPPAPAPIVAIAPPSALTVPPAGLLDTVSEGPFEFQPPLGFVRHVVPLNRDLWKWEHSAVKSGENTMVLAMRRRLTGDSFDAMIRRSPTGLAITTPVGAFAWKQSVSESRSQTGQLQAMRLNPTVQQRSDRLEMLHVLMDEDYVLYVALSCDRKQPQHMTALDTAAQSIRRRPPLSEKTPAPPPEEDQSPLSKLVEELRRGSSNVRTVDAELASKLPAATDAGLVKWRVPAGFEPTTPRDTPASMKVFNRGGGNGATIWVAAEVTRPGDHLEHRITRTTTQTRAFVGTRFKSWKNDEVELSLANVSGKTMIRIQPKIEGQTHRFWLIGLTGRTWVTVGVECAEQAGDQMPTLEAAAMSVMW